MSVRDNPTAEEIVAAYKDTGSVWRAAAQVGMSGQGVWERLRALGYPLANRKWTEAEVEELKRLIANCTLSDIAQSLGRPYYGVAMMASRLKIVSRYGNRVKRKVPRGSGLTKPVVRKLVDELKAWDGSIRQFCLARGLSIDVFALAVQTYEADTWKLLAWQRGLKEKTCPECESTFYPMTSKQATCSRRCSGNHRRNQQYFGGRRRDAIGMREGMCQMCAQPKASLQAHHMLGKENDPDDEWLIALCAGCHRLVGIAATRKVLDTANGWERFIELVLARRLAEQDGEFKGTHVSVDVEYLTESDLADMGIA